MNLWLTRAAERKFRRFPFGAGFGVKRLIVNADDLGFTRDVNEGILRSHLEGIVSSSSLMANGSAFDDAVRIAERHPTLDVGCHLVLVQGESVSRPGEPLPSSVARLLADQPAQKDVVREFRAQIGRLVRRGIRPTHLDTHKHVYLLPPVLDAVLQVAEEHGIRWIRKPFDTSLAWTRQRRAWLAMAVRPFRIPFEERLERGSCRTTAYFGGLAATGSLEAAWLVDLLAQLPGGVGGFVRHPGCCGPELSSAATRLKESRQAELGALCSPAVKRAVAAQGIELISYRHLGADPVAL